MFFTCNDIASEDYVLCLSSSHSEGDIARVVIDAGVQGATARATQSEYIILSDVKLEDVGQDLNVSFPLHVLFAHVRYICCTA